MKKIFITSVTLLAIFCLHAQSVRHVFMPYEVKYNSKNPGTADSLTEDNFVVINDYPVKVTQVPLNYNTETHNEKLYNDIRKGRSSFDMIKYPTSTAFPAQEGYTMHVDGNSSDVMTVKGFLPETTFGGYYYRIDADKAKRKYTPGFCPNGVYYTLNKKDYFITASFGSTYSKILIFRVENNQLVFVNQFGIPGRDMSIRIGKKMTDLKADNLKSFSSTAGGAYFSVLANGTIIVPVNIKQGNLKGLMTIDFNRFIAQYPNEQKTIEDKETFVKIYGSKLDEEKNTETEYINAAMPYDLNRIWLTSSTAKVILLDMRYPSQALLYDMNTDTIPAIKEEKDAMVEKLKESFNEQFTNNGSEHQGSYPFTFYNDNWTQIKSIPANMGKYKKCVTKRFKNNASKCTCYDPRNPADVEKYNFTKEYILKKIYYNNKLKFTIKKPTYTRFQDHVIQNSFAVDGDGAAYVVTNFKMCKFTLERNEVKLKWSELYNTGFLDMPGHVKASSGTTPTVFGNYVAITDNAFPILHLNVYNKTSGKLYGTQEVFKENHGACENSVVVLSDNDTNGYVQHSLMLGNSFGYMYAFDDVNYTHGGLEKYLFSEDSTDKKKFQKLVPDIKFNSTTKNNYIDIKTATPKMNIHDGGIVYMYNKQRSNAATNKYANWQLTALDYTSGNEVYSVIPSVNKGTFKDPSFKFLSRAFSCGNKNYEQKIFDNIWGTFSQTQNGGFIVATLRGFIFMPNQSKK